MLVCRSWQVRSFAVFALISLGCDSSDVGESCHIDSASACRPGAVCWNDEDKSCDSELCIGVDGEDPYCTASCSSDADCENDHRGMKCLTRCLGAPDWQDHCFSRDAYQFLKESACTVSYGDECKRNDDCEPDLACAYGQCRHRCESGAACTTGVCTPSDDGVSAVCTYGTPFVCFDERYGTCIEGLLCAVDQYCRKPCSKTADCPEDFVCAPSGECASPQDLGADGAIRRCHPGRLECAEPPPETYTGADPECWCFE